MQSTTYIIVEQISTNKAGTVINKSLLPSIEFTGFELDENGIVKFYVLSYDRKVFVTKASYEEIINGTVQTVTLPTKGIV